MYFIGPRGNEQLWACDYDNVNDIAVTYCAE